MFIVDRFEGMYAVCENENNSMVNILLKLLPNNIKEGDCIEYINGEYKINNALTEMRKKEIDELTKKLWG